MFLRSSRQSVAFFVFLLVAIYAITRPAHSDVWSHRAFSAAVVAIMVFALWGLPRKKSSK